ncbi:MAG: T9SS type A sorting domain-containing protein [Calditrichae bacterium]|nr:T9SS type A sorting domain-containing protein [Calditrichota bacterium]MCB9058878.1 T9SS type A sorting domain-containing protein [Calditrichia bacterium]
MAFGTKMNISKVLFVLLFLSTGIVFGQGVFDGGPGGTGTDWSVAVNWDNDAVPSGIAVLIPDGFATVVDASFNNNISSLTIGGGTDGSVTLNNDLSVSGNITINPGAELDLGSGNTFFWDIASTFQINGTFTMGTGTLTLGDRDSYVIESDLATIDIYNIEYIPGTIVTTNNLTFQQIASGTPNFRINGTFKRGGRTNSVLTDGNASISYVSGSTLEYDAVSSSLNVTAEWPTGNGGTDGVYNLNLLDKTINLNAAGDYQVITKLTRSAGSLTITSGTLIYASGATLEYNHGSQQTVGPEWTASTAPDNVSIVNTSGAAPAVDLGSTDLAGITGLNLQVGSLDYSAGGHSLTVSGNIQGSTSYGTVNGNEVVVDAAGASITSNDGNTVTFYDVTISADNVDLGEFALATGGTLTINGASSDLITVREPFTLTGSSSIVVTSGILDLNGINIVEGATSQLSVSTNGTLRTGGSNITGYNSYPVTTGTFVFDGGTNETIPNLGAIGTLEVDGGTNATTSGTLSVSAALNLTNGTITSTAANLLSLDAGVSIAQGGPTDFVIGPLAANFNSGNLSFDYPIGYSGTYLPATFTYDAITSGTGTILLEAKSGNPGGNLPSGISAIASHHYYTLQQTSTPTGSSAFDVTLTWTGSGFATNRNQVLVQTGTGPVTYNYVAASSQDGSTVTRSNINTFPTDDFILAIGSSSSTITWTGGGDGTSWNSDANWDVEEPQDGDVVVFPNGVTNYNVTYDDATAAGTSFASISINSTIGVINLTLSNSTISLTGGSPNLVVEVGNKLIFDNSSISSYNEANTTYNGQVEYQAGSTVYVDTYDDLIINGATGTTGGTVTVNADLTKEDASTFSGTVTVGGSTAANAGTLTGTLNLNGDVVFGGGSITGAVTFGGSSDQNVSGSGADFTNVVVNNSGGDVLLGSATTISGSLTLTSGDINTSGGSLTLESGATVSSGSNSSHINGAVSKVLASTSLFTLPVGNGSKWRRVGITPESATSETYTVRFFNNSPPAGAIGAGLNHISTVEYWTVSNPGGTGASITLHWEDASDGVDQTRNDIVVAQLVGSTWTNRGGSTSGGLDAPGKVTSNEISGTFSTTNFTLASTTADNSLPVEMAAFEATPDFDKVTINWKTASEVENLGFNIYRKSAIDENWIQVNDAIISGRGNYSGETNYEFVDNAVVAGQTYEYKLESVSINGVINVEKTVELQIPVPTEYVLFKNYPNPFNPTTNLKFQLPEYSKVTISVYDISGRLVKTLLDNAAYNAGQHVVSWDATNQDGLKVSSGMYFYRFNAGSFNQLGRMILLK